MKEPMKLLDQLRVICTSFPLVEERLSHGEPTWFYKGKRSFAMYADHHHGARLAVWCAAPPGIQEAMIAHDPARYFRPPYVGPRGWLGVYLDVEMDWEEMAGIIEEAYLCVSKE